MDPILIGGLVALAVIVLFLILACWNQTKSRSYTTTDNEDDVQYPTKYDMTPSEVHEYKEFEKTIQGEIYVERRKFV